MSQSDVVSAAERLLLHCISSPEPAALDALSHLQALVDQTVHGHANNIVHDDSTSSQLDGARYEGGGPPAGAMQVNPVTPCDMGDPDLPPLPPPLPQLLIDAVNISDAHGGTPLLYAVRM